MNDTSTTSETALDRAFALLKCSPIKDPENSSEYGRAAYNLSEYCQGKEDVSEAAMRIFAHRIAELEHERDEAREDATTYYARFNELKDLGNKLADECDRILGLGLHQNTLPRFKAALEAWRKNN